MQLRFHHTKQAAERCFSPIVGSSVLCY